MFLVVECSFAYNAILGMSWKVITSTYHLMIKFPTEYGVGEVRGDQVAERECYIAMMEMDDYLQTVYSGTADGGGTNRGIGRGNLG